MGFIGVQPTSAPLTSSDIADDIVNSDHLGNTTISGFDALTTEPADTDEFLISDGGVLKRIDASLVGGSSTADTFFASSGLSAKDLGSGLHIKTGDSGNSVDATFDELVIEGSSNGGMTFAMGNSSSSVIAFSNSNGSDDGNIIYRNVQREFRISTAGSERMRLSSSGDLMVGKTSLSAGVVGGEIRNNGRVVSAVDDREAVNVNRNTSDGNLVILMQANSTEGTISVSGSTVSYNSFCGSHWSRLADNSKPTILRGTVMESIGTMMTWYQAVADVAEATDSEGNVTPAHQVKESINLPNGKSVGDTVTFTSEGKEYTGKYVKEDNEQLPMCKISDTENSKAVYGVFMAWDDADDGLDGDINDMYVAGLGAFLIRIHKDETVAIGDYLQSKGDGTAKKQADDILRASTIAKVTSTEKIYTYDDGSYCVPCTLHCG